MANNQSHLQLLIGKIVTRTEYNTSTVVPINTNNKDISSIKTSVFVQIYFEDYRLNIYNAMRVIPSNKSVNDFIGLHVVATYESKDEVILSFENDYSIVVNMKEEGYSDPEAMYLSGPNNFWTVWN